MMISYLVIGKRQAVFKDNSSNLADLIGFGLAAAALEVDSLLHSVLAEEMVGDVMM